MVQNRQNRVFTRPEQTRRSRDTLATFSVLALWRLRQTWWQLLLTGLALLTACTIACLPTLFSTVADTAGLQALFNGAPARSAFALQVNASSLSSQTVSTTLQDFEKVIRPGLGPYLSTAPASLMITTTNLFVTAPERLTNIAPLSVYAASLPDLHTALHLVQGHWASEQMTDGVFEIMLTTTTARALNLSIGSTLTLQSNFQTAHSRYPTDARAEIVARLAGIFTVSAPATPELGGATLQPTNDYLGRHYAFLMSSAALLQACDQIAARMNSTAVSESKIDNPFRLNWYYHLRTDQLQFSQINDLTSRLASVQYKVSGNTINGTSNFPYVLAAQFLNPAPTDADILSLLGQYTGRVAIINVPISLLAFQVIALLLFFACLLMNQLVERQMAMSALLNSRGASTRQVYWSLMLQALVLSILTLLLGPLLAFLLVDRLSRALLPTSELTAVTALLQTQGQVAIQFAPYLVGTFLAGILATSLPCLQATRVNVLELRRETTRASRQPFWTRYYLDLLAAVLALSSFGTALYLAQAASTLDIQTQELVVAPLTLAAPLFLLLGGLLLFLRAFPPIMRYAASLTRRTRGTTVLLALAQMARAPRQTMRLIMLLALAISFATFTLVFNTSQSQRALDIAAYESGADFSGTLPDELVSETQNLLDVSAASPDQLSSELQQTLAARYSSLPGVLATSAGYIGTGTSTGLGGSQISLEVHAVDSSSYARAALWGPQESTQTLASLMSLLRQTSHSVGTTPAIVDETTLNNLHLSLGNNFVVTASAGNMGDISMSFQVIAVVQHIPGVNGSAGITAPSSYGGVLVDFQTFSTNYLHQQSAIIGQTGAYEQILTPNYIWLHAGASPATLASVRSSLTSHDLALTSLYDRQAIAAALQGDPLIFSMLLMLGVGSSIALSLALLGNGLSLWLRTRQHLRSFVVLRALGARQWQITSIFLWEEGIVYLAAFALSLVFGVILANWVVPALIFTGVPAQGALSEFNAAQFYLLQRALPPRVIVPASLPLVLAALLLLSVLALVLLARVVARASATQELRLNED